MPIARPVSDDFVVGSTSTTPVSPATYFDKIDEAITNDADYITLNGDFIAGSAQVAVNLSAITDPVVHSGHVLTVRARTGSGGVGLVPVTVALLQSGVQVAAANIALSGSFGTGTYTLTAAEAASLTNYANLQMYVSCDSSLFGVSDVIDVSQLYLTVPTAPFYDVFLWARPDE